MLRVTARRAAYGFDWATRSARAETGCVFYAADPVHQATDGLRHAQQIQAARDRKDFATADSLRERAIACGFEVAQDRVSTVVTEHGPWRKSPRRKLAHVLWWARRRPRAVLRWVLRGRWSGPVMVRGLP